ncbi:hypothetical protein EV359DRAFT_68409 [Lentinula novae-zelandiae]|nr:hypothetical protein EV359DRAFT_68409 [Lentinula novae-zelandiae]
MSKHSDEPTFPKPPQAPYLLHELWDLNLGNVKAPPHIHPHIASPLPPPQLEDTNHYPASQDLLPGLSLCWELPHPKLSPPTSYNNLKLTFLATTVRTTQRNPFKGHVMYSELLLAPFKLQLALSTLQLGAWEGGPGTREGGGWYSQVVEMVTEKRYTGDLGLKHMEVQDSPLPLEGRPEVDSPIKLLCADLVRAIVTEKRKDSALDPGLTLPFRAYFMEAISSEIAENSEEAPPQVEKEIDEEQAKNVEKKSESGRKRMSWRPTTRLLDPDSDHASKKAFSPSKKIIQRRTSSSLSSVVLDASGLALGALATAAQYAPTPYLGTLASISLSILNAIQGAKDNKDSLKQLASTITSLSNTVVNTYHRLHPPLQTENSVSDAESKLFSSDPMLNQQVEDLLSTLREIEDIVQRQVSRTLIRRVISSRSDSNIIQDYKDHLNQALEAFTLQSNIVLRETLLRVESKQEELVLYSTSFVARPLANTWLKVEFTGRYPVQVKEDQLNGTMNKSRRLSPVDFSLRNQSCLSPSTPNNNPFENVFSGSVQGNITVNNFSGDHSVISNVDNSRRENFGNVYHTGSFFLKNDSGLREEMFGGSSYGRGADHWENYHRGADAGSSEVYSHSNHGDVGHPDRRGRERMQRWENSLQGTALQTSNFSSTRFGNSVLQPYSYIKPNIVEMVTPNGLAEVPSVLQRFVTGGIRSIKQHRINICTGRNALGWIIADKRPLTQTSSECQLPSHTESTPLPIEMAMKPVSHSRTYRTIAEKVSAYVDLAVTEPVKGWYPPCVPLPLEALYDYDMAFPLPDPDALAEINQLEGCEDSQTFKQVVMDLLGPTSRIENSGWHIVQFQWKEIRDDTVGLQLHSPCLFGTSNHSL